MNKQLEIIKKFPKLYNHVRELSEYSLCKLDWSLSKSHSWTGSRFDYKFWKALNSGLTMYDSDPNNQYIEAAKGMHPELFEAWRAEKGGRYFAAIDKEVHNWTDLRLTTSNYHYEHGNYFQTEELAQASIPPPQLVSVSQEKSSDGITDDTAAIQAEVDSNGIVDWVCIKKGVARAATEADIEMVDRDDNGNKYRDDSEFNRPKSPNQPSPFNPYTGRHKSTVGPISRFDA